MLSHAWELESKKQYSYCTIEVFNCIKCGVKKVLGPDNSDRTKTVPYYSFADQNSPMDEPFCILPKQCKNES